jgi:hypothetical protein
MDAISKKWIAIAFQTGPMDKEKVTDAIIRLYAAAGLQPPKVIFVPSPFVGAMAFMLTNAIIATHAATYDATYAATYDAIDAVTRDATYDATDDATDVATRDATYDATYAATRAATVVATTAAAAAAA